MRCIGMLCHEGWSTVDTWMCGGRGRGRRGGVGVGVEVGMLVRSEEY